MITVALLCRRVDCLIGGGWEEVRVWRDFLPEKRNSRRRSRKARQVYIPAASAIYAVADDIPDLSQQRSRGPVYARQGMYMASNEHCQ